MLRRHGWVGSVFVSLLLVPAAALAQPAPTPTATTPGASANPEVEALVQQGLALRRDHRDQEALELFQRARARSNEPRIVAQIGFAEQAVGRWIEADTHLREARAREDDPWVAQRRTVIDEALGAIDQRLGRLEVSTNVAGAAVIVDGRASGRTPLATPVRVVAGTVNLEVRADGYVTVRRSLQVSPQNLSRERVELVATVAGGRVVVPPPGGSGPEQPEQPHRYRPLAIAAAIGGVVGLGFGTLSLIQRNGYADEWNNDARCLVNGQTRSANCQSDYDSGQTWEALSIAGFAVGGALAVTAGVLFVLDGQQPARRASRPVCGPGPGTVGLGCVLSF